MLQSSANQAFVELFQHLLQIIDDNSGCLMVQQSVKMLLLHIQVSSHSHCGIDFNHSGSIRDTVIIKTCVRGRRCVSMFVHVRAKTVKSSGNCQKCDNRLILQYLLDFFGQISLKNSACQQNVTSSALFFPFQSKNNLTDDEHWLQP